MRFFDLSKPIGQWIVLFFLAFIWGSSFILMKRGLISYSHDVVASLRLVISFTCFIPIAIKNLKKVKRKDLKFLFLVGLFGNGIPAFLFTKAETGISSSLAGMLNSLVPLFTILIGYTIFKIYTNKLKFIGVFIGLIGAIVLLSSNGVNIKNNEFEYGAYVVLATICYAISVNTIKKYLQDVSALIVSSFAFLFIGPPLLIYLFTTDFITITVSNPNAYNSLFYIAILSLFGTALSLVLFNLLVKHTTAVFASTVTYLIPIFAIFWGIIDGETIHFIQVFGVLIILIGIYFVNKFN